MVVHPASSSFRQNKDLGLAGVDPRHNLHHLSLLPSGPDEIHDRLLRGVRPGDPRIAGGRTLWRGFSPA